MNIFEKATRKKLRFNSNTNAKVDIEDLWDLPLEILDEIAQDLAKEVKGTEPVSFIKAPARSDEFKLNILRFEVVKRVIEVRLGDRERAEKAAATRANKQRALEVLEKRKEASMDGLSDDELKEIAGVK